MSFLYDHKPAIIIIRILSDMKTVKRFKADEQRRDTLYVRVVDNVLFHFHYRP